MKPVRFLRPAELELLDAAQYYEIQATGLGREFLDKIDAAISNKASEAIRPWPAESLNASVEPSRYAAVSSVLSRV